MLISSLLFSLFQQPKKKEEEEELKYIRILSEDLLDVLSHLTHQLEYTDTSGFFSVLALEGHFLHSNSNEILSVLSLITASFESQLDFLKP